MEHFRTLDFLWRDAASHGTAAAVIDASKPQAPWSFDDLNRLSIRLAAGLKRKYFLLRRDKALVFAENSPAWLCACAALIRSGVVMVPLDSALSLEKLQFAAEDSGARIAFVSRKTLPLIAELSLPLDIVLLDGPENDPRHWRNALGLPGKSGISEPDDVACLFYDFSRDDYQKESLTHRNLAWQVSSALQTQVFSPGDRVFAALSFSNVSMLVKGILPALALGISVVTGRQGGEAAFKAVRGGNASVLFAGVEDCRGFYRLMKAAALSKGGAASEFFRAASFLSEALTACGIAWGHFLLKPFLKSAGALKIFVFPARELIDGVMISRLEAMGWNVFVSVNGDQSVFTARSAGRQNRASSRETAGKAA